MFDENGNYNSTLKKFHQEFEYYSKNGDDNDKRIASFILTFILK